MPFNGSGVFSIVNTFTPGTTISSAAVNANFTDIASGLSDVLTRDGQAPMTAALKLINGTSASPSLSFASDPTTGIYRASAGTVGIAGNLSPTGNVSATGTVNGSDILKNGSSLLPIGLGPVPWSGSSAPGGWVLVGQTLSRTTYASLWAFAQTEIAAGNTFYGVGDGSTTFTLAVMNGIVPAGVDAAASRVSGLVHVGDLTGAATYTILTANLPPYTPSGTLSMSGIVGTSTNGPVAGTSAGGPGGQAANNGTFVGTAQGGTSTPFSIVQPSRAFNYIVYAGV